MSRIEVEYQGQTIHYSENEDEWQCWELNVKAPTLSVVKTKVQKILADNRRVDNVPVIVLRYGGWDSGGIDCVGNVTLIANDRQAWVTTRRKKREDQISLRREKIEFANLVLDTPENRRALADWKILSDAAKAAEKQAKETFAAVPRVTRADFNGKAESAE